MTQVTHGRVSIVVADGLVPISRHDICNNHDDIASTYIRGAELNVLDINTLGNYCYFVVDVQVM